jgi:hypothetical protein
VSSRSKRHDADGGSRVHAQERRLESKVVGIESADHPTDGEIIARAKSYFKVSDRMG